MNAPFSYFGGKARFIPQITANFPPRMNAYIEPFCGSAAVFFSAPGRWANVEVLNDLNGDIVNFFKVLRDQPEDLIRLLELTPHSRGEYNAAWEKTQTGTCENDLERARCLFIRIEQSFSRTQRKNSWNLPSTAEGRNKARDYMQKISWHKLMSCAARLKDASIENDTAENVIKKFDREGVLFYLDPPYLSTAGEIATPYRGLDMNIDQHIQFLELVKNIKGMAIISGYMHESYNILESEGWQIIQFKTLTLIDNKKTSVSNKHRTEILWINPACQKAKLQKTLF